MQPVVRDTIARGLVARWGDTMSRPDFREKERHFLHLLITTTLTEDEARREVGFPNLGTYLPTRVNPYIRHPDTDDGDYLTGWSGKT